MHSWEVMRHSFLKWSLSDAVVFGHEVVTALSQTCEIHGRSFAGIVAQPTYTCMYPTDSLLPCGRRALMTPLASLPTTDSASATWLCQLHAGEPRMQLMDRRVLIISPMVHAACDVALTTVMNIGVHEAIVESPPAVGRRASPPATGSVGAQTPVVQV